MQHKNCALSMSLIWHYIRIPLPKKSHDIIAQHRAQAKPIKGFLFGVTNKNLARFVEFKTTGAIEMINISVRPTDVVTRK